MDHKKRKKASSSRAFVSTATGIRTRVSAVRGRRPSPLDDSGARGRLRLAEGPGLAAARVPCGIFAEPADVAELVDAHGSGPCGGNSVEVRVLSSASIARPRRAAR